jgi:type II secretory ATPase GspE/PulE/Tfp pilus assembly ATPase PilB-like protein
VEGNKSTERTGFGSASWAKGVSRLGRIGDLLVEKMGLSREEIRKALEHKEKNHVRLGEAIVELGFASESDILRLFAQELNMRFHEKLEVDKIFSGDMGGDMGFFSRFSKSLLENMAIIPFRVDRDVSGGSMTGMVWAVHVITSDPWQYREILHVVQSSVRQMRMSSQAAMVKGELVGETDLLDVDVELIGYLAPKQVILDALNDLAGRVELNIVGSSRTENQDAMAYKQILDILSDAIRNRVTDIHISPLHHRGGLHVRYRVDGTLFDAVRNSRMDETEFNRFVNKIMHLANMDYSDKQTPQDGKLQHAFERYVYDMRVSSAPTSLYSMHLESVKITIRILYKTSLLTLENLGLFSEDLDVIRRIYTRPHGMTLVTGFTSSGKTTTIYAMLRTLNLRNQAAYTIEDPVEYQLENAYQIQVDRKRGNDYAQILRNLMRQDPDIIFIGEIRDAESGIIALQAAQTGHSVFSTLHTNDAASAAQRLLALSVPSYLLIGNISGVISQRLVRRNCPKCLAEYRPSETTLRTIGIRDEAGLARSYLHGTGVYNGEPCPECGGTGTLGRIGIFEVLPLSLYDGWEDLIKEPLSLAKWFRDRGHGGLLDDARRKLELGYVSAESLKAVLSREENRREGENAG